MIEVSIYRYLVTYRAKQKHLLPLHVTNNKLKEFLLENPNKNIFIYCIGYVKIKDSKYVKINSVNPLYLIINKENGYFEEINGSKYLMPVSTNESK